MEIEDTDEKRERREDYSTARYRKPLAWRTAVGPVA